jgi:hypothetical protein
MGSVLSRGEGEAAAGTVAAGRRFVDQMSSQGVERVDVDALSSLICAGWLPQDRTFESELTAGLEVERDPLQDNVIAHRTDAGHSQTLADTS